MRGKRILVFKFFYFILFIKMPRVRLIEKERKLRDKEIENQKRKGTIFQNIKRLFSPKEVKELLNNFPSNISKYFVPNVSTLTFWIWNTDFNHIK
jgi:hypothetical protein